eukprot:8464553-Pyramimonas_sp.AAC.1
MRYIPIEGLRLVVAAGALAAAQPAVRRARAAADKGAGGNVPPPARRPRGGLLRLHRRVPARALAPQRAYGGAPRSDRVLGGP